MTLSARKQLLPIDMGSNRILSASNVANYADQENALIAGLTSGSGLTSLYAAIANRNNARVDIPIIGDSITEGASATTLTSRWVTQVNRAIRATYPTTVNGISGGLGFIPFASTGESSFTWPISRTSGPAGSYVDLGPVRQCGGFDDNGAVWQFTAPPGTTSVQIAYYDGSTPGGFSYQVGSGSTVTINNTAALLDAITSNISIQGGQVLTITAYSGGNCFITGIVHFAGDESSGITVHGCGHFGWCAGTETNGWNQAETYSLNWAQTYIHTFPNVAGIGIMLGINDADTSDGNKTASAFATDLGGLITTIRGSATALTNIPIWLITEYAPNIAIADSGGWSAYAAAIRGVASTYAPILVTDLSYRMPVNNGSAPYWADNYHPTDLGHVLIAEIVAAGLRIG